LIIHSSQLANVRARIFRPVLCFITFQATNIIGKHPHTHTHTSPVCGASVILTHLLGHSCYCTMPCWSANCRNTGKVTVMRTYMPHACLPYLKELIHALFVPSSNRTAIPGPATPNRRRYTIHLTQYTRFFAPLFLRPDNSALF
jgi:hypothetical protein